MNKPSVIILSDSVGETAELVMKAGLSQFTNGDYNIRRIPYVEDEETIDETIEIAIEENALIGFTLVDPKLRQYVLEKAKLNNIEAVDIMGPMMDAMEKTFKKVPKLEPGLLYKLDQEYFKRIEAIEFAVRYDDGRDPSGIEKADIVLIGVSRTSKTPLSQYLAMKSYKVANVPIVPEVDPPKELYQTDPSKCYGLKISPVELNEIRKERLKTLGLRPSANYANVNRIREELDYFENIVEHLGCPVIDVTNKAVEETANLILQIQMTR